MRVRMIADVSVTGREIAINQVLEEESANGAEVVDIRFTSTLVGSRAHSEHVALILLRGGQPT